MSIAPRYDLMPVDKPYFKLADLYDLIFRKCGVVVETASYNVYIRG